MDRLQFVPVARGLSDFEARVVSARLGSEGIVWQLRGADSLYPSANVEVLVPDAEYDDARLLLEAVAADDEPPWVGAGAGGSRRWAVGAAVIGIGAFVAVRVLASIVLAADVDPARCATLATGTVPTTAPCRP